MDEVTERRRLATNYMRRLNKWVSRPILARVGRDKKADRYLDLVMCRELLADSVAWKGSCGEPKRRAALEEMGYPKKVTHLIMGVAKC